MPSRASSRPSLGHVSYGRHARGAATSALGMGRAGGDFIGIVLAYILYIQTPALPGRIARKAASALYQVLVQQVLRRRTLQPVVSRPLFWGSDNVLNRGVDHDVIDGLVDGTGSRRRGRRRGRAALEDRQRSALRVCLPDRRGRDRRLLRLPGDGADGRLLADRADLHAAARRAVRADAERRARAIWRSAFIFSLIPLAT